MINAHQSMKDVPPVEQAKRALAHILGLIRNDPFVGWYLGYGTESFAAATEAFAALEGRNVLAVRQEFAPTNPRDPKKEPRGDEPRPLYFSEEAVDGLRSAASLLENLAAADTLAAATNREHRTFDLLLSSSQKDEAAGHVRHVAAIIDERRAA